MGSKTSFSAISTEMGPVTGQSPEEVDWAAPRLSVSRGVEEQASFLSLAPPRRSPTEVTEDIHEISPDNVILDPGDFTAEEIHSHSREAGEWVTKLPEAPPPQ